MHHRRLAIGIGLVAAWAHAAVVYKWTDAGGVIHLSDHPVPGAQVIVTTDSTKGISAGPSSSAVPQTSPDKPSSPLDYTKFAIGSPAPEQVFFGDQTVSAVLDLEPGLRAQQTITWQLNGTVLADQPPDATSITLATMPRGTYTLAATVTDTPSGQSRTSGTVTFYVHQPSELSPQHKKP